MKKGQLPLEGIVAVIIGLMVLGLLVPALTSVTDSMSCQNEKKTITSLQGDNAQLQNLLAACRQELAQQDLDYQALIQDCYDNLDQAQEALDQCQINVSDLQDEIDELTKPEFNYIFIKVYDDRVIVFNWLILYQIHIVLLLFSLGIGFTVKLFDINVEVNIKLLNKKEQRKIRNKWRDFLNHLETIIREYLSEHPWQPTLIVIAIIVLTNVLEKVL